MRKIRLPLPVVLLPILLAFCAVDGQSRDALDRPAVAIAAPGQNGRTSLGVMGTARDPKEQISQVVFTVTNLNDGTTITNGQAVLLDATGTSAKWAVTNGFLPGTNIITVTALNVSSNASKVATRRFFYQVPAALSLTQMGAGKGKFIVKSFVPGEKPSMDALNIGQEYQITAIPVPECFFSGWTLVTASNTVSSAAPAIAFIMESNISLQASFETNFYLQAHGVYNGLFMISNSVQAVTGDTAGLLGDLVLRTNGAYSGKLMLAGRIYTFTGAFDAFGISSLRISRPHNPIRVNMILFPSNDPPFIAGSVAGTNETGPWVAALTAQRATNALPSAEYTMLIPPDTNNAPPESSPGGYSYLAITNSDAASGGAMPGSAKISGIMADGAAFSESTAVSQFGDVPVYASMHGSQDLLLGWINLESTNAGTNGVVWIHSGRNGLYPDGFTNVTMTNLVLSPWTNAIAGVSALTHLMVSDSANETNAAAVENIGITVSGDFKFAGESGSAPVTGVINPKTGVFNVTIGSGREKTNGFGAIVQSPLQGGGFFLTRTNGQSLKLTP